MTLFMCIWHYYIHFFRKVLSPITVQEEKIKTFPDFELIDIFGVYLLMANEFTFQIYFFSTENDLLHIFLKM